MDVEKIKRKNSERRTLSLSIKISPKVSKWLKDQSFSPTGIFYEALKDLKCPHLDKNQTK